MSKTVFVTEHDDLKEAIAEAVRAVMLETVPHAVREASAPEWMERDEVCQRYGLTPRQLTYMRGKGSIEYTQHGRRILYRRASLEHWFNEGRVPARRAGRKVA